MSKDWSDRPPRDPSRSGIVNVSNASFGKSLAAAVDAVVYSGGTFLECTAGGRARRGLSDLLLMEIG